MLFERLYKTFGSLAFEHAIFYSHESALRIELAGDGSTIEQFCQALDRCREIASYIFKTSKSITVVQAHYLIENRKEDEDIEAELLLSSRRCGVVPVSDVESIFVAATADHENRLLIAYEVDKKALLGLMWGVLAQELDIKPRLSGEVYISDPSTGVLIHPYDDRGMDIIGNNEAEMTAIFHHFNPWLLKHDMERMERLFSVKGS